MDKKRIEFLRSDFIQGFPAYYGFSVEHISEGRFETNLAVGSQHRQQDGFVQLKMATEAVFKSWNGKRAIDYRNAAGISHDLGLNYVSWSPFRIPIARAAAAHATLKK